MAACFSVCCELDVCVVAQISIGVLDGASVVLTALNCHPESKSLQTEAILILSHLSHENENVNRILQAGGMQAVLSALQRGHVDRPESIELLFRFMTKSTDPSAEQAAFVSKNGVETMMMVLKRAPAVSSTALQVLGLISRTHAQTIVAADGIAVALHMLSRSLSQEKIVLQLSNLLRDLVGESEQHARLFVRSDGVATLFGVMNVFLPSDVHSVQPAEIRIYARYQVVCAMCYILRVIISHTTDLVADLRSGAMVLILRAMTAFRLTEGCTLISNASAVLRRMFSVEDLRQFVCPGQFDVHTVIKLLESIVHQMVSSRLSSSLKIASHNIAFGDVCFMLNRLIDFEPRPFSAATVAPLTVVVSPHSTQTAHNLPAMISTSPASAVLSSSAVAPLKGASISATCCATDSLIKHGLLQTVIQVTQSLIDRDYFQRHACGLLMRLAKNPLAHISFSTLHLVDVLIEAMTRVRITDVENFFRGRVLT